jgi:hypothetical protein
MALKSQNDVHVGKKSIPNFLGIMLLRLFKSEMIDNTKIWT